MSDEELDRIIEEAGDLYESGRIGEAIELLRKIKRYLDEESYIVGMYNMGSELKDKDNPRYYNYEFECFKEAAEMGDTDAMFVLSTHFYTGRGCQQNDRESFYWIKKAYDTSSSPVYALELAYYYQRGEGTGKDVNHALSLFKEGMQCDDYDMRKDAQEGYDAVISEINNAEKKEKWKNRGKTALNVLGAFAQGYANASSQYDDDYDD